MLFSLVAVAVLAASILMKLWMAAFNREVGRRIQSTTLMATAADSRNDVISTAAVLAATVVSHLSRLNLDGWMGLAVALFILYSGVGLVRDTLNPLLGEAPSEELTRHVHDKVMSYPAYWACMTCGARLRPRPAVCHPARGDGRRAGCPGSP